MNNSRHDARQQKLLALQADVQNRMSRIERHMRHEDGPVSPDFADQASETSNDETIAALRAQLGDELAEISLALQRIEAGKYGLCVRCGERIEVARLDALPFVQHCVDCSSA